MKGSEGREGGREEGRGGKKALEMCHLPCPLMMKRKGGREAGRAGKEGRKCC
jgi:hypothetical protein